MKQINIDTSQILELLESFKVNIPNDISDTIIHIHNKYCSVSYNNNIKDIYVHIKNYWLYTTYMICNILSNNTLKFRCFLTKNIVESVYSDYLEHYNVIFYYYYFPQGNETFILIIGGGYNLPIAVYYPYKDSYIHLPHDFGTYYNNCIDIINNIKSLEQIINNLNNNKDETSLSVCFFAWCSNPGHHIWNEVSGIYPLIVTKLLNNIDIVVIGDWDIFNIGSLILEHNPRCKIVKYKDFINDPYYICKNIKYGLIGEGYIINETQLIIKNHINCVNYTNKFVLCIVLKLDRRCIQNITRVYINLINKLISTNIFYPENLYLLFDGLYKHETEQGMSFYTRNKDIYDTSVKDIINNIDSSIEYKSLIGICPRIVSQHYNSVKYFIGCAGSNIYCIQNVYKKNGCVIYPKFIYDFSPNQDKHYVQDYQHNLEEIVLSPNDMDQYFLDDEQLYNVVISGIKKIK